MRKSFAPRIALGFSGLLSLNAPAAPVRFDINHTSGPTQVGWISAVLGNGTNGTVSIATTAISPATVASRDRGALNTDGAGADAANAAMWNDFVFANGSTAANVGSGLQVAVSGLVPGATYPIRIWAFDDSSNPGAAPSVGRTADWSAAPGSATLTFPASPDPASLNDYTVGFLSVANGSGMIVLTGIVSATNPDTAHNVFINGLEIGDVVGDADGDGMQDGFEQQIIDFNPTDSINTLQDVLPGDDFDNDASTNKNEETRGTSPVDPDTDDDTVPDGAEDGGGVWVSVMQRGTNPFVTDTDNDGLSDGVENRSLPYDPARPLTQPGTDPNLRDTDGDKGGDFREVTIDGTDPTNADDVFDPLADAIVMFDFNAVDVNAVGSPVQAGWTSADRGTGTDGTVSVTTSVLTGGGAVTLDARDRATGINTDGANADIANGDLWRDFVFASGSLSTVPGSGLQVTLTGLLPLTSYPIRIWAFDEDSNGGRYADWGVSGVAAAGTLTFPTQPDPASLLDYMVQFDAVTDASGGLVLDGLVAASSASPSHNVFINALVVGAPGSSTLPVITSIVYDRNAGSATVTWTSLPGRVYAVDASTGLANWLELSDNVESQGSSTTFIETGLAPTDTDRYYRVRPLR